MRNRRSNPRQPAERSNRGQPTQKHRNQIGSGGRAKSHNFSWTKGRREPVAIGLSYAALQSQTLKIFLWENCVKNRSYGEAFHTLLSGALKVPDSLQFARVPQPEKPTQTTPFRHVQRHRNKPHAKTHQSSGRHPTSNLTTTNNFQSHHPKITTFPPQFYHPHNLTIRKHHGTRSVSKLFQGVPKIFSPSRNGNLHLESRIAKKRASSLPHHQQRLSTA